MGARDLSRSMLEAWSNRDWDAIRGVLHPDYRYIGPDGEVVVGVEAGLAAAWSSFADAFPDGKWEIDAVYVDGNTVITEFHFNGTHTGPIGDIPASGNPVDAAFCNVMQLEDGKVILERDYFDTAKFYQQVGAG